MTVLHIHAAAWWSQKHRKLAATLLANRRLQTSSILLLLACRFASWPLSQTGKTEVTFSVTVFCQFCRWYRISETSSSTEQRANSPTSEEENWFLKYGAGNGNGICYLVKETFFAFPVLLLWCNTQLLIISYLSQSSLQSFTIDICRHGCQG